MTAPMWAVLGLNDQGLFGALRQYWAVEPKPRLHRRNTYFDDNINLSNTQALRVGIVAITVSLLVVMFGCIGVMFI